MPYTANTGGRNKNALLTQFITSPGLSEYSKIEIKKKISYEDLLFCGSTRVRTADPLLVRQML
jgi:hypothetical protein